MVFNGEELCKIIKFGKVLDELMFVVVFDVLKEIVRCFLKDFVKGVLKMVIKEIVILFLKVFMGIVIVVVIFVDFGFLIFNVIDLNDFYDGNLCNEVESLRCVIK